MELTEVNPEVAAATLAADLASYWSKGLPELRGITRLRLHPLTEIIGIPGRRPDGTLDPYHLKIEANHYGPHPVGAQASLSRSPGPWPSPARRGCR